MIPPLDKIQENLLRFRYLDNSLHFLSVVCENSSSPFASTVFHKYMGIDLVSFLDHYNSFIGMLNGNKKKLVVAMNPFIEEIIKNKDELKRTRNKWVAHVINQGDFVDELSKPSKPISSQDMILMINGLNLFVKGLEMIFPHETNYIIENFTKEIEEITVESPVSNETLQIIVNSRIELVNASFKLYDCSYQFTLKSYHIHEQ